VTGPAVTVGLVAPNIGGEANVFRASATVGRETRRYGVRYFERYLGSSDTSLETALYRNEDRFVGYRQRLYGASTEAGKPLGEYLKLYLRLRLEDVKFTHRKASRHEPLKPYQTVAVRTMLDYDRRDSDRWPTRGFRVAGGVEGGYADGTLVKFLHSFGYYKTVTGDLIYAYEHDFGLLPYRASRVGITERFFMGGTNDLRGFSYRGRVRWTADTNACVSAVRRSLCSATKCDSDLWRAQGSRVPRRRIPRCQAVNFRNPRASTGAGF
jgi:outer membrane protein assembly factor BamA